VKPAVPQQEQDFGAKESAGGQLFTLLVEPVQNVLGFGELIQLEQGSRV
jgi:hypothetical protein